MAWCSGGEQGACAAAAYPALMLRSPSRQGILQRLPHRQHGCAGRANTACVAPRRSVPTPTWVRDDNSEGWGFEWKGPKGFHCVRPDFDIVVPMYAPYTRKHLVSPFAHPRNISVLLRFKVDKTDGKYLIANHGAAGASPV